MRRLGSPVKLITIPSKEQFLAEDAEQKNKKSG